MKCRFTPVVLTLVAALAAAAPAAASQPEVISAKLSPQGSSSPAKVVLVVNHSAMKVISFGLRDSFLSQDRPRGLNSPKPTKLMNNNWRFVVSLPVGLKPGEYIFCWRLNANTKNGCKAEGYAQQLVFQMRLAR
ncbi:MAG TPA: hypothetical protein VF272_02885 [Candidatus Saccharimonadia bacterium]